MIRWRHQSIHRFMDRKWDVASLVSWSHDGETIAERDRIEVNEVAAHITSSFIPLPWLYGHHNRVHLQFWGWSPSLSAVIQICVDSITNPIHYSDTTAYSIAYSDTFPNSPWCHSKQYGLYKLSYFVNTFSHSSPDWTLSFYDLISMGILSVIRWITLVTF